MRYLTTSILLFFCLPAFAQPKFEAGFSGGLSMPAIKYTNTSPWLLSLKTYSGWTAGALVNLNFRITKNLYAGAGLRGIHHSFKTDSREKAYDSIVVERSRQKNFTDLAIPVVVEFRTPLDENISFRAAAGGGIVFTGRYQAAMAEASAGLMFNENITVGLRYYKSFAPYVDWHYNRYALSSVSLEVRKQFSKPINDEQRKKQLPTVEAGAIAGAAFPHNVREEPGNNDEARTAFIILYEMNFAFDKMRKPVNFYFGPRLGGTSSGVGIVGLAAGLQWWQRLQPDQELRIGAGIMPMAGFMGVLNGEHSGLAAEGSAGVVINDRVVVGVKYLLPFYDLYTFNNGSNSYLGHKYKMSAAMVQLLFRVGNRRSL